MMHRTPGRSFEAQSVLFAPLPPRLALQQLSVDRPQGRGLVVNVWRNHAIEPLLPLCDPYLAFAGLAVDWRLSAYDDSLSFFGRDDGALDLLWLDSSRYLARMSVEEFAIWLSGRLASLRQVSSAPIVVAGWLPDSRALTIVASGLRDIVDCYWADIGAVCHAAEQPIVDARAAAMSGTPLGAKVHPLVARNLVCHWLCGAMLPPVKAVAVDLDNTLYRGVLGEDGVAGVELTEGHRRLHEALRALRQRGIFLAVVSRNEEADVDALFAERGDFPLRREDFSMLEVSWGEKADGLLRIADHLQIGIDSILFVDDNLGELIAVEQQLMTVQTVHARADAYLTAATIDFFPGLWRWRTTVEDSQRVADMAANDKRRGFLAASGDDSEYFRNLGVHLAIRHKHEPQLPRLAELCGKTNQFNLAVNRLSEVELLRLMARDDAAVCGISLADRLTDSGIVGVVVATRSGQQLLVEELCISCRALGRRLESAMVLSALRSMALFEGCDEVVFAVAVAPRNGPARDWLKVLSGMPTKPCAGRHAVPASTIAEFELPNGITLEI